MNLENAPKSLEYSKLDDLIDCDDGNITHVVITDRDLATVRQEAQRHEIEKGRALTVIPKKAASRKKFWDL